MKILDLLNESELSPYIAHYNKVKSKEQQQQIYQALENKDIERAKKLMNNNPETYSSAMYYAFEDNQLKHAETLIKLGANPNVNNRVVITHAASKGEIDKLEVLHRNGGDLKRDNETLNWAIQMGHLDTVKWLKDKGVPSNNETFSMLHRFLIEIAKRKPELVTPMVELVLSMNPKPKQFVYPSMLDSTSNNREANSMLKQYGDKNRLMTQNKYDALGNQIRD